MKLDKALSKIANAPMVGWDAAYSKAKQQAMMLAEDQASALAVHFARLSAYLSRRINGGLHADAVKAQNKVAAKVRQALGYTYKNADITF